jgi:hypothetical protein
MAFTQAVVSSPETGLIFHGFGRRNFMHATAVQTGGAGGHLGSVSGARNGRADAHPLA